MENVSFLVAFGAGLLTFMSPCILPLIPVYISYLTGISFQDMAKVVTPEEKRRIRSATILHSLSFILGFSVVFVILGAGITFMGQIFAAYQGIIKRVGGLFIMFFALAITGLIRLPFLEKERKMSYRKKGISVIGSVIVGATFAAAWTPCVGPILGSILVYASSTASIKKGIMLLTVFSLGLAVPFFISALVINSFLAFIKKIEKYLRYMTIAFGVVLLVFGATLLIRG